MKNLVLRNKDEVTKGKKKKGFTLIELIIVIAIIAILAAIAIPKFAQVKQSANIKSDIANAKQIATAVADAMSNGSSASDAKEANSTTGYLKYLNGGKAIYSKVDTSKELIPSISDDGDIKIYVGSASDTNQVYPTPDSGTYAVK